MIYVLHMTGTHFYKVGMTERDPMARLHDLQTGCPHKLELYSSFPGDCVDEAIIHTVLNECMMQMEWFLIPRSPIRFIYYRLWKAGVPNKALEDHLEPLPDKRKSHRLPAEINWEIEMMRSKGATYSDITEALDVSDVSVKNICCPGYLYRTLRQKSQRKKTQKKTT